MSLLLLLLPWLLALLGCRGASGAVGTPVRSPTGTTRSTPAAATVGDIQPVYDWRTQNCAARRHAPDTSRCAFSFKCKNTTAENTGQCRDCDPDVVDAPTKAFRRRGGAGVVETVLTGSVDWGSRYDVGPTLDSVEHACPVYYNGTALQQPRLYASREWIQSPWIFENQTVVGLTHMEHHCDDQGSAGSLSCPALNLTLGGGDFSAVTLLASSDGGRSWSHARAPPRHVVAASPQNFSVGGNRLGFRSPSNIVAGQGALTGWFYATVTSGWGAPGGESACDQFVDPLGLQRFCTCMMRTRDLTDPHSWRAWDGEGFGASLFATPFDTPAPDPAKHVCVPTINMTYPSLLWSTHYSKYIVLGTRREPFNVTPMAANSIPRGSPHVPIRTMGVHRTCGEPDGIKKNTHPKNATALFS